jgi:polyvinyl alcohol dehydrogenase (cytochrome)
MVRWRVTSKVRLAIVTGAGALLALVVANAPGANAAASAPTTLRLPPSSLGALTTYDYGNARSGHDTVDPAITGLSAGSRWDDSLDAGVYAQPLIYDGTAYVATENDTVYAINAKTGAVQWHVHTGRAVSTSVVDQGPTLSGGCGDINPLGITGTPVIDTTTDMLFAVEETYVGADTWQDIRHWLVAVSLKTHRELWHRGMDPPRPNGASTYYIAAQQQRPALTLLGTRLYAEYGGLSGDCGQYHGYVVSVPTSVHGAFLSYQVPTQREGGIWGTGGAYVSAAGNLYVATGNGSSNTASDFDEGNAVIELSPTLHRLGFWAPANWVELNDDDWDLGSAGPMAVPDSALLFAAGKPVGNGSFGNLMEESPLRGIGKGAYTGAVCLSGGVFGADAADVIGTGASARVYLYAPCGNGTQALVVNLKTKTFKRSWLPSTGSPNGPPIVAGGLVWALDWNNGDLYGMVPSTGKVAIQRTTDSLEHFATPSVGDGMVLVPTAQGVEAWSSIPHP